MGIWNDFDESARYVVRCALLVVASAPPHQAQCGGVYSEPPLGIYTIEVGGGGGGVRGILGRLH